MKKSIKFNKKIVLFILFIMLFFIHFIRNAIIISSLNKKITKYENITNYHEIWSTYSNESITIFDVYYKDGKYKQILTHYDYNSFIKNDEPPSKVLTYRDENGKETTFFYNEKIISSNYKNETSKISPQNMSHITMAKETPLNFILSCFNSFITSDACNGIDAYKIYNIIEKSSAHFSKETGLTIRSSSGFSYGSYNEEQKYVDCISDIIYEFYTVTDEDFLIPSTDGFIIQEN